MEGIDCRAGQLLTGRSRAERHALSLSLLLSPCQDMLLLLLLSFNQSSQCLLLGDVKDPVNNVVYKQRLS